MRAIHDAVQKCKTAYIVISSCFELQNPVFCLVAKSRQGSDAVLSSDTSSALQFALEFGQKLFNFRFIFRRRSWFLVFGQNDRYYYKYIIIINIVVIGLRWLCHSQCCPPPTEINSVLES